MNDQSIRELKKIATALKIKGYGSMNKETLVAAITGAREV
ncbi:Rho termination factor N-terminal domain-containing protein [Nostoc sp. DSM 114167]